MMNPIHNGETKEETKEELLARLNQLENELTQILSNPALEITTALKRSMLDEQTERIKDRQALVERLKDKVEEVD